MTVDLAVTFTARDGYFSVILEGRDGKQYLIYRDIAIFNELNIPLAFSQKSFETALLDQGVLPKKIILNKSGCDVQLRNLHTALQLPQESSLPTLRSLYTMQRYTAVRSQVDRINQYNRAHQILWFAEETSLSHLSYATIRTTFDYLNEVGAYGLEHYGGGIYTPMAYSFDVMEFLDTTTEPYVESFDWSDRHGLNWNSPCRSQFGTQSCWAQAAASGLESYINRYYGRNRKEQVSVLQIIACSGGLPNDSASIADCGPGFTLNAAEYLAKEPIVSEEIHKL